MRLPPNRQRTLVVLILSAPLLLYLAVVLLTPTLGTIVGYADEQPPLRMIAAAPADAEKIRRLAKLHFDERPALANLYWPEPSAIEEKANCWLVTFATKTPIYRFCGVTQTLRPTDRVMYLSIDKADYRTRFGKWCQ